MATLFTLIWVLTYTHPTSGRQHEGAVYFRNAVPRMECEAMASALRDYAGTNGFYPLVASHPICAPVNGSAAHG
jgi:hypothetical protein